MAATTGNTSERLVLATILPWVLAALCLGMCAIALVLWETDLAIRRRLPDMGYNDVLELRDDAWLHFRAPLAWAFIVMSVGAFATGCIPALFVRQPVTWIPAAISAVIALGMLGYLVVTR